MLLSTDADQAFRFLMGHPAGSIVSGFGITIGACSDEDSSRGEAINSVFKGIGDSERPFVPAGTEVKVFSVDRSFILNRRCVGDSRHFDVRWFLLSRLTMPYCSNWSAFRCSVREASPERGERSEEHTSELQSPDHLVSRLLLEKKKQHSRY